MPDVVNNNTVVEAPKPKSAQSPTEAFNQGFQGLYQVMEGCFRQLDSIRQILAITNKDAIDAHVAAQAEAQAEANVDAEVERLKEEGEIIDTDEGLMEASDASPEEE